MRKNKKGKKRLKSKKDKVRGEARRKEFLKIKKGWSEVTRDGPTLCAAAAPFWVEVLLAFPFWEWLRISFWLSGGFLQPSDGEFQKAERNSVPVNKTPLSDPKRRLGQLTLFLRQRVGSDAKRFLDRT